LVNMGVEVDTRIKRNISIKYGTVFRKLLTTQVLTVFTPQVTELVSFLVLMSECDPDFTVAIANPPEQPMRLPRTSKLDNTGFDTYDALVADALHTRGVNVVRFSSSSRETIALLESRRIDVMVSSFSYMMASLSSSNTRKIFINHYADM